MLMKLDTENKQAGSGGNKRQNEMMMKQINGIRFLIEHCFLFDFSLSIFMLNIKYSDRDGGQLYVQ